MRCEALRNYFAAIKEDIAGACVSSCVVAVLASFQIIVFSCDIAEMNGSEIAWLTLSVIEAVSAILGAALVAHYDIRHSEGAADVQYRAREALATAVNTTVQAFFYIWFAAYMTEIPGVCGIYHCDGAFYAFDMYCFVTALVHLHLILFRTSLSQWYSKQQ